MAYTNLTSGSMADVAVGDTIQSDSATSWYIAGPQNDAGNYPLSAAPSSNPASLTWVVPSEAFSYRLWPDAGLIGIGRPRPTNTVAPSISGPTTVGQTLNASVGTWTGSYSDFVFAWFRNGAAISGATSFSYTLTSADAGHRLCVAVAARNSGLTAYGVAYSALTATVASVPAPANTVAPTISGTATVNATLTATAGTWTGSPTSYSYAWYRYGNESFGVIGTASTLTVVRANTGYQLFCRVTATNAGGSVSADTSPTAAVTDNTPANTSLPVISGSPVVGQPLTTTTGSWTNSPTSYAYQWRRNSTNISGATSSSYTLQAADAGNTISVIVIGSNSYGAGGFATSAATAAVTVPPPVNTVLPAISGTAALGNTLTISNGTWSGSPTGYAIQWKLDGTTVTGRTGSSFYVGDPAMGGKTITATVTATNSGGSVPATSNGVTVAAPDPGTFNGEITAFPASATNTGWTNPNNVFATDGVFATYNPGAFKAGTSGAIVPAFSFSNVDIPPGSTITGVTLTIQRRGSNTTGLNDSALSITLNGSTTSNLASATKWPTTVTAATYGGSSNTLSLSSGALSRPTGNSVASVSMTVAATANQTASLDSFAIKLNYSVPVVSEGGGVEIVAGDPQALIITGLTGAVRTSVVAPAGSPDVIEIEGQIGSIKTGAKAAAGDPAALLITGVAGQVRTSVKIVAGDPDALVVTGIAGDVNTVSPVKIEAGDPDVIEITGLVGFVRTGAKIAANDPDALVIAGLSGAVHTGAKLQAGDPDALVVDGQAGSVRTSVKIEAGAPDAIEIIGKQGAVNAIVSVRIEAGPPTALVITGETGEVRGGTKLTAGQPDHVEIVGQSGAVKTSAKSQAGSPSELRVTGLTGAIRASSKFVGLAGSIEIAGQTGAVRTGVKLSGANDNMAITGAVGAVRTSTRLRGLPDALVVSGRAGLFRSSVRLTAGTPDAILIRGLFGDVLVSKGPIIALDRHTYFVPANKTVHEVPKSKIVHEVRPQATTSAVPASKTVHEAPKSITTASAA